MRMSEFTDICFIIRDHGCVCVWGIWDGCGCWYVEAIFKIRVYGDVGEIYIRIYKSLKVVFLFWSKKWNFFIQNSKT